MNTQYTNATDINYVWFALSDIGISYSVHNERSIRRKSSHFGDFDHLRYQIATLENTVDDLLVDRAKLYRTANDSLVMLNKALTALHKGKSHVTDDHIERVIDYLANAIDFVDTNPDQ